MMYNYFVHFNKWHIKKNNLKLIYFKILIVQLFAEPKQAIQF